MNRKLLGAALVLPILLAATAHAADAPIYADAENLTGPRAGPLIREIVRQSFLVAAREQLSQHTLDRALMMDPKAPPADAISFKFDVPQRQPLKLEIFQGAGDAKKSILKIELDAGKAQFIDYAALLTSAEAASRKEFPAALASAGVSGKPVAGVAAGDVPADIMREIDDFSVFSQFIAVRHLHDLIAKSGESPARLIALSRAYANLGYLTHLHWTNTHKTYYARALVYAQRAVATGDPKNPDPLYARAYANCLAGLHAVALADFEAAEKIAGAARPPAHCQIIVPWCRFNDAALDKLSADKGIRKLVLTLQVARCYTDWDFDTIFIIGAKAMAENPDNAIMLDYFSFGGDVTEGHRWTEYGIIAAASAIPGALKNSADTPAPVKKLLDGMRIPTLNPADGISLRTLPNPQQLHQIPKALADAAATDTSELRWDALGSELRDTYLNRVAARAKFLRFEWAIGVEETRQFVNATAALIKDHPYERYYKAIAATDADAMKDLLSKIPADAGTVYAAIQISRLKRTTMQSDKHLSAEPAELSGRERFDVTFDDFDMSSKTWTMRNSNKEMIEYLQTASPHNAHYAGLALQNWEQWKHKFEEWNSQFGNQPRFLLGLGLAYEAKKDYKASAEAYTRLAAIQPSYNAYSGLAKCYLFIDDPAAEAAAIKGAIANSAEGVGTANMRAKLVYVLLRMGDKKGALEVALKSAESYSGAGLYAAAAAYEASGDMKKAESFIRASAERYDEPYSWFYFCVRTGSGDIKAARASVGGDKIEYDPARWNDVTLATILEDPKIAEKIATEHVGITHDPLVAILAAGLAVRNGSPENATKLIDAGIADGMKFSFTDQAVKQYRRTSTIELLKLKKAAGLNAKLDPKQVAAILGATDRAECTNLHFELGVFAEMAGDTENAIAEYTLCRDALDVRSAPKLTRVLAGHAITRLKAAKK